MKAIRLHAYAGPLALDEIPAPAITDDDVLVKIKSAAVNHLDLVEASGAAKNIFPIDLPWIPGHEFSGVVERLGKAVDGFAPGDAVFGNSRSGAYAEYLAVRPAAIVKKPSKLSYEEAASVPVAAQTAWQGIFTHGRLAKGQSILIHGGAGAVGAYAVQLAAQAGAKVIVTASGADESYLTSIGASRVIDYRKLRFENELRDKVDVVFDLIGGETQQRSFQLLRKGGYLIAANQPVSQEEAAKHGVTGLMMNVTPSAEGLGRIARLLEAGSVRTDVAAVYALEEAARAWEDLAGGPGAAKATRRKHGKIILRVA
ncbi:MAG TPA: NADP-dependent oxidoreductase [Polyangia bacterium]|nr:NADP-dependent oxidoreductase [Polyangia bacterium]